MELEIDQFLFLLQQGIPLARVYDASGLSRTQYREAMKDQGLWVAFGVTPCKRGGHTLRTRAGTCVQCNTAVIAFMRRHDEGGEVYAAYSASGKVCKIGSAKCAELRIDALNRSSYGGWTDWTLLKSVGFAERAGLAESQVQRLLVGYRVSGSYVRGGEWVNCYELFNCDPSTALYALESVASR